MNLLLCGSFDAAEQAEWAHALQRALPGHRLLQSRGEVDGGGNGGDGGGGAIDAAIDAAIVANPPAGSLRGLSGLRLIQSLWAGVDRLLADDTLPVGVPIARMVDPAMADAMAETALWATLALHRRFFDYARQQADAAWQPLPQRRAEEVTVLVLGHGQMGRAVARRLAAQQYPVLAWRRGASASAAAAAPGVTLVEGPDGLRRALPQAQVLINLLPLTRDTRGIVDAALLAALPEGAGVVNLARGGHVVDADLLAALDSGHIGHAVLDVFAAEPLPAVHRYWRHPRVTVLPHAAALTDMRSAAALAAANIEALAAGLPLVNLVERRSGY